MNDQSAFIAFQKEKNITSNDSESLIERFKLLNQSLKNRSLVIAKVTSISFSSKVINLNLGNGIGGYLNFSDFSGDISSSSSLKSYIGKFIYVKIVDIVKGQTIKVENNSHAFKTAVKKS